MTDQDVSTLLYLVRLYYISICYFKQSIFISDTTNNQYRQEEKTIF